VSTHTTYFCDACNSDYDISAGEDDGHAINHGGLPAYDGWAEFQKPYTDSAGHRRMADYHVCAHCLAAPDFEPDRWGEVPEWDDASRKSLEAGRKHGEAFAWAEQHLGTADRFGWRGVRQVFGSYAYGYRIGPKLEDGRFSTSDRPVAARAA
jgi:hypothetical protein